MSRERNFARFDSALHKAPNVSVGKIEGKLVYDNNKTDTGYAGKSRGKNVSISGAMVSAKEVCSEDRLGA